MARIHREPKKNETAPGQPLVPSTLHDVDFMVKDSKRFADSGGWGYAEFEYEAASDTFRPGTAADQPPQGNDAKCGFACRTIVKKQDYVFTESPRGDLVSLRRRSTHDQSERCVQSHSASCDNSISAHRKFQH